jgi:hypothetical protein
MTRLDDWTTGSGGALDSLKREARMNWAVWARLVRGAEAVSKGNSVLLPCLARLWSFVIFGHIVTFALDLIIDLRYDRCQYSSIMTIRKRLYAFNEDRTDRVEVSIGRYGRSPPRHGHKQRYA